MSGSNGVVSVLEQCRIAPPPNTVGERSLPLTAFDLPWLMFHPVHQLFFYSFPHSKSHFMDTLVPKLKHSLSITLQHFFPFAGNLIVFPKQNQPKKPEIRYVNGDYLPLTFSECANIDFHDLKGNHPRECVKFYPLVPLLESAYKQHDGLVKIPLFSIQVTLFPNSGITIGLTNHHSLCDARTMYDFLMAWTEVAKHDGFLASSTPFYDRVIEYPNSLDEMLLNLPPIRGIDENYKAPQLVSQIDRVRSTVVLTRSQINWLKKWLLAKLPTLKYVSSFAVGCGYIWSCIAKSRVQVEGKKGEDEVEGFCCIADWRARLSPPVPLNYFGNCGHICMATTKAILLTSSNGFPTAVETLGKAIMEGLNTKEGVFKDMETSLRQGFQQIPHISVAGTPKLDVYNVDFGFGKPEKYETVSLDFSDAISVNASRESSDDLEIGLCLPAKQMDAFIAISTTELESILNSDSF